MARNEDPPGWRAQEDKLFEMQGRGVQPGGTNGNQANDGQTRQPQPPLNVTLDPLPTAAPLPSWRALRAWWNRLLGRS